MADLEALQAHLAGYGSLALGYSGGVDSSLLAVAARRALGRDRFIAVIGRSASYPAAQYDAARELAGRFDVPLLEIDTRELADPRYQANTPDRCYFCKSELWDRLGDVAAERRMAVVADGTNADDLGEHRPGLRAAAERRVRSPLAELGWTKADVRDGARVLGLPIWSAPASPCLSSRLRYGLTVTPERLRQIEEGEALLRALGVIGDLRVRHLGDAARIEVAAAELDRVRAGWGEVVARFEALGFRTVELDPRGYRRGSLLAVLEGAGS